MIRIVATVLALATLVCGPVLADLPDPSKQNKEYVRFRMQREALFDKLAAGNKEVRGLFFQSVRWPPSYTRLQVCFVDGDRRIRSYVARVAQEWNKVGAGISLDFGPLNNPRSCEGEEDIRVWFGNPEIAYWSMVGVDSVAARLQSDPSMSLGGFHKLTDKQLRDPFYRSVVLHEFGHALGLEHEHQSPAAACDVEYNWNYIYELLGSIGWDKEMVDFNMRSLAGEGLEVLDYDRDSIMMYDFPPEYFVRGRDSQCFTPLNSKLSRGDKQTLLRMYPKNRAARLKAYQTAKQAFQNAWQAEIRKRGPAPAIDLSKYYFKE